MRYLAVYLLSLLLFLFSFHHSQAQDFTDSVEYYGQDHTEAEFTLPGELIVLQPREPTRENVDPLIRQQMRYMLGLMRSREHQAAALYPKWTFSTRAVKPLSPGRWLIKYNLKTKGVFAKGTTQYSFTIPYNPLTVFQDSERKCMKEAAENSNFWYHWEPLIEGCPLVENTHYYNTTVTLQTLSNTVQTYPEYEKLVDANKTIKITMFFGFENYGFPNWHPEGGEDWGIRSYNIQARFLRESGFQETIWSSEQIERIYKARDQFVPYVAEFTRAGALAQVRVRMVLLDTGYSHNSLAFHHFLKESLANENVIFYNGHSGIGKNLDLANIEKLRGFKLPLADHYQILFLGSCVPYSYYTDLFFSKKQSVQDPLGTRRLDILSYGKESFFGSTENQVLTTAIVRYALNGTRTSYQEIVNTSPLYFFGVAGDEDNPTQ